jgi:hypothetical protein
LCGNFLTRVRSVRNVESLSKYLYCEEDKWRKRRGEKKRIYDGMRLGERRKKQGVRERRRTKERGRI